LLNQSKKIEASADSCEASFYALRAFLLWSFFRPQTKVVNRLGSQPVKPVNHRVLALIGKTY